VAKAKSSTPVTTETTEEQAAVKYFKETRAELRKVTWPTQDEAKNLTLIITSVSIAMAFFLGIFDYIFQTVIAGIISGDWIRIVLAVLLFIGGAAGFYFNNRQE